MDQARPMQKGPGLILCVSDSCAACRGGLFPRNSDQMDQTFKNEKEVSPMIDIVIHGINGRMGQVLCELISQRQDCRVAAGVDLRP